MQVTADQMTFSFYSNFISCTHAAWYSVAEEEEEEKFTHLSVHFYLNFSVSEWTVVKTISHMSWIVHSVFNQSFYSDKIKYNYYKFTKKNMNCEVVEVYIAEQNYRCSLLTFKRSISMQLMH